MELVTASGLEKAAMSALYSGRPIRARRLFEEAIEAGTRNAFTFHKYSELLYQEKDRDEVTATGKSPAFTRRLVLCFINPTTT